MAAQRLWNRFVINSHKSKVNDWDTDRAACVETISHLRCVGTIVQFSAALTMADTSISPYPKWWLTTRGRNVHNSLVRSESFTYQLLFNLLQRSPYLQATRWVESKGYIPITGSNPMLTLGVSFICFPSTTPHTFNKSIFGSKVGKEKMIIARFCCIFSAMNAWIIAYILTVLGKNRRQICKPVVIQNCLEG